MLGHAALPLLLSICGAGFGATLGFTCMLALKRDLGGSITDSRFLVAQLAGAWCFAVPFLLLGKRRMEHYWRDRALTALKCSLAASSPTSSAVLIQQGRKNRARDLSIVKRSIAERYIRDYFDRREYQLALNVASLAIVVAFGLLFILGFYLPTSRLLSIAMSVPCFFALWMIADSYGVAPFRTAWPFRRDEFALVLTESKCLPIDLCILLPDVWTQELRISTRTSRGWSAPIRTDPAELLDRIRAAT